MYNDKSISIYLPNGTERGVAVDAKSIGRFIVQERKKRDLSRKQLAAQLKISPERLAMWERGFRMPEPGELRALSGALSVSVGELLAGRRIVRRTPEMTDEIILAALEQGNQRGAARVSAVLLGLGAFFLFFPMAMPERDASLYHVTGFCLILTAVWRMCRGRRQYDVSPGERRAYVLALLCQTAALALEVLPYGAALLFSLGAGGDIKKTFSYFSVGQGESLWNTATGIFTVGTVLLSALGFLRRGKLLRLQKPMLLCSVAALLLSAMPWILGGAADLTVTSVCVSCLLLASVGLQTYALGRACA